MIASSACPNTLCRPPAIGSSASADQPSSTSRTGVEPGTCGRPGAVEAARAVVQQRRVGRPQRQRHQRRCPRARPSRSCRSPGPGAAAGGRPGRGAGSAAAPRTAATTTSPPAAVASSELATRRLGARQLRRARRADARPVLRAGVAAIGVRRSALDARDVQVQDATDRARQRGRRPRRSRRSLTDSAGPEPDRPLAAGQHDHVLASCRSATTRSRTVAVGQVAGHEQPAAAGVADWSAWAAAMASQTGQEVRALDRRPPRSGRRPR